MGDCNAVDLAPCIFFLKSSTAITRTEMRVLNFGKILQYKVIKAEPICIPEFCTVAFAEYLI